MIKQDSNVEYTSIKLLIGIRMQKFQLIGLVDSSKDFHDLVDIMSVSMCGMKIRDLPKEHIPTTTMTVKKRWWSR